MNEVIPPLYIPRPADANTIVRLGVGVIILNPVGEILLEQRSDCGWWGVPGGRVEPGESIAQTVQREVYEETGLTIEITGLLGVYSGPAERIVTYPDNVVQLVDVVLVTRLVGGVLTLSHESLALQFFSPAHLPTDIVPPARQPLADFIAGITAVVA